MPALRALLLEGDRQFGNAGTVALAGATVPALRSLNLRLAGLSGSSGVAAIAGAWHRLLVRLDVSDNRELGGSSATALAQADWRALRLLGLAGCGLQDEGFVWLMQATGFRVLQVLNATCNRFQTASLDALDGALQAGRLPQLAALYLSGNHL